MRQGELSFLLLGDMPMTSSLRLFTLAVVLPWFALSACVNSPALLPPVLDDNGNPVDGDTTSPVVTITAPAPASTVVIGQSLLVEGSATDDRGVATVTASLGGTSQAFSVNGTTAWSFVADTSLLAPGTFTFVIRAVDSAGNAGEASITLTVVDRPEDPVAVLTGLPTNPTGVTTLAVTVSGTNVTQYKYRVDSNPFSDALPISEVLAVTGLTEGEHTLEVVGGNVDDEFQLEATPTAFTWTIDLTPPAVSLSAPITDPTAAANSEFTATVDPSEAVTFNYTITRVGSGCTDSSGAVSAVGTTSLAVDQTVCSGNYTLSVTATDAVGNVSTAATRSFVVDRMAPSFTLTPASPTSPTNAASVSFTATTDPSESVTFTYSVSYAGCTGSNLAGTAVGTGTTINVDNTFCDGAVTLSVTATDALGNVSAALARSYTVDRTAPSFALTPASPTSPTNTTSTVFTATTSPSESVTFTYSVAYASCAASNTTGAGSGTSTTISVSNVPCDGVVTLSVTATDSVGNQSTALSRTYTVDRTAPAFTLTPVSPTSPTNAVVTAFTATTDPSETVLFEHSISYSSCPATNSTGSTNGVTSAVINVSNTPCDGVVTLSVTASDALGNTSVGVVRSYTVDRSAPAFTLTPTIPADPTNATNETFTATTSPSESAVWAYTVTYANCAASNVSGGSTGTSQVVVVDHTPCDGLVTLSVTAADALGNISVAATRSYTVIRTGPPFTLLPNPPPSPTADASTTFTATAAPAQNVDFAYTVSYAGCPGSNYVGNDDDVTTTSITITNICEGLVTLSITATDDLGNTTAAVVRSYTFDQTAPSFILTPLQAVVVSPSNAASTVFTATTDPSETVNFTWSITRVGIGCSDTSGSANAVASTAITVSNTVCDGAYSVAVTATDGAGNASTLTRTYTVDRTAPLFDLTPLQAAVVSPTNANSTVFTATTNPVETLNFSWVVTRTGAGCFDTNDSANGVTNTTITVNNGFCDGAYSVAVTATDVAGNLTTLTRTYSVDRTAPTFDLTPLQAALPSPTNAASTVFTATTNPSESIDFSWTITRTGAGCSNTSDSALGVTTAGITVDNTVCDGAYSLVVTATDALGNFNFLVRTYSVDRTLPTFDLTPLQAAVVSPTNSLSTVFTATTNPNQITDFSWTVTRTGAGCSNTSSSESGVATSTITVSNTVCDGAYSLAVTATDAAGNTVTHTRTYTVDRTSPTFDLTPLQAAVVSPTNASATVFTATTNPSETTDFSWTITRTNCTNTSSSDAAVTSTVITVDNTLCDGPYSVAVTATDALGNATTLTRTYSVDRTAPLFDLTPLQAAVVSPTNASSTVFTATTNPSEFTDFTWTITRTNCANTSNSANGVSNTGITVDNTLCDGAYSVAVTATDAAGNATTLTRTYTVDRTAPLFDLTPLQAAVVSPTNASSTVFTATTNPSETTDFSWTITRTNCANTSSSDAAVTSTSITVDNTLCDGAYSVAVTATDAVGNATTLTRTYSVDRTAPLFDLTPLQVGVVSPTNLDDTAFTATTNPSEITDFSWTITRTNCANTSSSDAAVTSTVITVDNTLCDGAYSVAVTATDAAGNGTTLTRTYTVDRTAPLFDLTPLQGDVVSPTSLDDTAFTATTNPSETTDFSWTITRTNCSNTSSSANGVTTTGITVDNTLCQGAHSLAVTATDAAGNTTTLTRTYTVDRVEFTLTPDPAPDSTATSTVFSADTAPVETVDFAWTVTRAGPGCSDDALATANGVTDTDITVDQTVCDGAYTLSVTATDGLGNTATRTQTYNVSRSSLLGTVAFIGGPHSGAVYPTRSDTVEWVLQRSNPIATSYDYQFDGGDINNEAFTGDFSRVRGTLMAGSHTLRVCLSDGVYTQTVCPETTFEIDLADPLTAPVFTGIPSDTNAWEFTASVVIPPSQKLHYTLTQGLHVLDQQQDGTSSSLTWRGLPEGAYNLDAFFTDASGRQSPTSLTTFTVDYVAPEVASTGLPERYTTALALDVTVATDDVLVTEYTYSLDFAAFSAPILLATKITDPIAATGWHNLRIRAEDAAGNVGEQDYWFFAPTTELFVRALAGVDAGDCTVSLTPCATIDYALTQTSGATAIHLANTATHTPVVQVGGGDVTLVGGWNATFTTRVGQSAVNDSALSSGLSLFSCSVGEHLALVDVAAAEANGYSDILFNASGACDFAGLFGSAFNATGLFNVAYLDGAQQVSVVGNSFTDGSQALVINPASTAGHSTLIASNTFTGQDYAVVATLNRSAINTSVVLRSNTFNTVDAAMTVTNLSDGTNSPVTIVSNTMTTGREGVALYQPNSNTGVGIQALIQQNTLGSMALSPTLANQKATGIRFNNEAATTDSQIIAHRNVVNVSEGSSGATSCMLRGIAEATLVVENTLTVTSVASPACTASLVVVGVDDSDTPPNFASTTALSVVARNTINMYEGIAIRSTVSEPRVMANVISLSSSVATSSGLSGSFSHLIGNDVVAPLTFASPTTFTNSSRLRQNVFTANVSVGTLSGSSTTDLEIVGNTLTTDAPGLLSLSNLRNLWLAQNTFSEMKVELGLDSGAAGSAHVLNNRFNDGNVIALQLNRAVATPAKSVVINGNLFEGQIGIKANTVTAQAISQLVNNTFVTTVAGLELTETAVTSAINNLFYNPSGPAGAGVSFIGTAAGFDGAANTFAQFTDVFSGSVGMFPDCADDSFCTVADLVPVQEGISDSVPVFGANFTLDVGTPCDVVGGGIQAEVASPGATQTLVEVRGRDASLADRTITAAANACLPGVSRGYREAD